MSTEEQLPDLSDKLRPRATRSSDGVRALLYYVWAIASGAVISLLLVLSAPLPHRIRYRIGTCWTFSNLWMLKTLCGLHWRVEGLENIPHGPAVILAKHQSAWETMALQTIFPRQVWVLKRELLWVPLIGWGLAMLSPIAINRKAGFRAIKEIATQGEERLEDGAWVVVFPEGTRTAPGSQTNYHGGGSLLASRANVPVVPVAHNAGLFWERNGFAKRAGTIVVRIGPGIDSEGRKPADLTREAKAWIEPNSLELLEPWLEDTPRSP